jgi:signal recognition particle GTPase
MLGLFKKIKEGLSKTHDKLTSEIKRIVTRSPRLTAASIEELEAALLAADLGVAMTQQILAAAKKAFESQGKAGLDFLEIAAREVEQSLSANNAELLKVPTGVTVVSIVGVNGTGKTTTSAKLAHLIQQRGQTAVLAACDTFRAAAVEQIKIERAGHRQRLRRGPGVRRARRSRRRAVSQRGLLIHRHGGPIAHQAQPDAGIAEGASRGGQEISGRAA